MVIPSSQISYWIASSIGSELGEEAEESMEMPLKKSRLVLQQLTKKGGFFESNDWTQLDTPRCNWMFFLLDWVMIWNWRQIGGASRSLNE